MKSIIDIDPIVVSDKNDVIKAVTILEKIGIKVMSEEGKEKYLTSENTTVNSGFLVQDENGAFNMQSHYIGYGISLENLEKQVDDIIKKYPDIYEKMTETENKINELAKDLTEKKNKLDELIEEKERELEEIENSFPYSVIKLRESKLKSYEK